LHLAEAICAPRAASPQLCRRSDSSDETDFVSTDHLSIDLRVFRHKVTGFDETAPTDPAAEAGFSVGVSRTVAEYRSIRFDSGLRLPPASPK
jgi:hypothetical protein